MCSIYIRVFYIHTCVLYTYVCSIYISLYMYKQKCVYLCGYARRKRENNRDRDRFCFNRAPTLKEVRRIAEEQDDTCVLYIYMFTYVYGAPYY